MPDATGLELLAGELRDAHADAVLDTEHFRGKAAVHVAPQRIEGTLLLESEVGQVAVFGDRKPYVAALIAPHPDLVREVGREHKDDAAALQEALHKRVAAAVARANSRLSTLERVRKFALLPEACTVDNGMMTPTLKLKRHVVRQRYAELLAGLFPA